MTQYFFSNAEFWPIFTISAAMLLFGVGFGKRRLMAFVAGSVALMLVWRLSYAIQSRRYFIILFVLMIMITAQGADLLETRLKSWLGGGMKYVVRAMFCLLILACFLKTIRVNPYQRFIIRAAEALKADAAKYARPIILDHSRGNHLRLGYYSGIGAIGDMYFETLNPVALRIMTDEAFNYGQHNDAVYFTVNGYESEIADFERNGLIHVKSLPRTRKMNKKLFSIYKYLPYTKAEEPVLGKCLKQYDMEKSMVFKVPDGVRARPHAVAEPGVVLPEEWSPNFGDGFNASAEAVLKIEDAWSGKALRLSSKKLITIFCPSRRFANSGEYRLAFRYQALTPSRFSVKIYSYEDDGRMQGQFFVNSMKTGKTSEPAWFRSGFRLPETPARGYSVVAICLDYGDILIDDLGMYTLEQSNVRSAGK